MESFPRSEDFFSEFDFFRFVRKRPYKSRDSRAGVYLTPNTRGGAISQVAAIATIYSRELDGEYESQGLPREGFIPGQDRTGIRRSRSCPQGVSPP